MIYQKEVPSRADVTRVLDAIHDHCSLSGEERDALRLQLERRDAKCFNSILRFLIGPEDNRINPSLTREMVETAVRDSLSTVLERGVM